jgi:hypothetical protein
LSKVIAGTFSILSDCALIAPCHALFASEGVIQVQVVMAQEVWVFGTKAQVFTQAYKIKNAWTIKHYLIDSGRGFEAKISKGLSANKQKAMQQIKQRFAKHKTQWVSDAKRAWQGAINQKPQTSQKQTPSTQ